MLGFLNSVLTLSDIVFIGPVGSGKSSLIGSLYRSVNEEARFPARVSLTLNHPDEDTHGTMQWMETSGNQHGTIIYQDTRGDQVGSKSVFSLSISPLPLPMPKYNFQTANYVRLGRSA